jgi:hypothetical protein
MDKTIYFIEGIGEYGIDTEASPGNGRYYVKLYNGTYNVTGLDTEADARDEFEYVTFDKGI